jgi:hypothetical protein
LRSQFHRNGLSNPERIPDRQNHIAHLNLRRVAQGERRQARLVNFKNRQICLAVGSHDAGRKFSLIVQRDFDIGTAVDDVIVRDDVTVRRNDDSGTEAALLTFARNRRLPELIAKKSSKNWIVKKPFKAASVGCDLAR